MMDVMDITSANEVLGQEGTALETDAQVVLTKAVSRDEVINALREIYKNSLHYHTLWSRR